MTIKTVPRARLLSSTSLFPMLRGPMVTYAPDEEGIEAEADETPEHFREQEGDREPDGEAAAPEPEPEEEAEEEPEPEAEEEAEAEEEPAAEAAPPPKKDWRERQIAKLREKEKAKDAELEELRKRAEAAEALLAASPEERAAAGGDRDRDEIRKEVAEQVRQEQYYKRLNDGLERMDEAGKVAFKGSWDDRIAEAREALRDEIIARPEFLEAVTDLPNAAAVYHELAGDLDRMEAVLKMPAHKMGMELARISDKLAAPAPKPVSKAPKPIKPLQTEGVERDLESLINDPNASMSEINKRMAAEERKRAKAH